MPFRTTGAEARPGRHDKAVSAVGPLCVMATAPARTTSENSKLKMYSIRMIVGLRRWFPNPSVPTSVDVTEPGAGWLGAVAGDQSKSKGHSHLHRM